MGLIVIPSNGDTLTDRRTAIVGIVEETPPRCRRGRTPPLLALCSRLVRTVVGDNIRATFRAANNFGDPATPMPDVRERPCRNTAIVRCSSVRPDSSAMRFRRLPPLLCRLAAYSCETCFPLASSFIFPATNLRVGLRYKYARTSGLHLSPLDIHILSHEVLLCFCRTCPCHCCLRRARSCG
ncbi:hypothetical protein FA95DRAFT_511562 [Auriscalpium vulgare]|uniref:Uncharacterized protein n=1 Tax=Auriscalpium vulgare TaxID=40419 RepID=A0ACB8RFE4_9AGAM|nr:hypothetical protein FA95DRAFT_511562 [Auriscalpium vulgare]